MYAGQRTQFVLGDVEPTAVFGREAQLDPTGQFPGLRRGERFVECPCGMDVEIITDDDEFLHPGTGWSESRCISLAQSTLVRR